jgi:hypothetical protein
MTLNPLWIVEPLKDAGVGNTPPVVTFEQGATSFQGPPRGIATSFVTKLPDPLTLTVWVTDDGKQPPEARPRTGPPANVSWSKFRGPGTVTFNNARPPVEADGKATTAATFGMPGEYILRAQANDATGDGGGGFQCCWTNVHVKVTVTGNQ